MNNIAEDLVDRINQNIFFKEFSFSKNILKGEDKNEFELADSIVWLDEILFLTQVKSRDINSVINASSEVKWFNKKVINKAKSQIKDTLKFFKKNSNLNIKNNRGFTINLKEAPLEKAKKLIIYLPGSLLPNSTRNQKFYNSSDVGLIHLFHIEDYENICKYLITPSEINEYLNHRQELYYLHGNKLNTIPEQVVFGHFLSGDSIENLSVFHVEFLRNFLTENLDFNLSKMLANFYENQINTNSSDNNYHYIVKEIAKLNRLELKEFKDRFLLSIEKSKIENHEIPYRITVPRTKCGFVFIPLNKEESIDWNTILQNLTLAHKYEQRISKCIGVVIFRNHINSEFIEIYWCYVDFSWEYDTEWEEILSSSFPFRKVRLSELGNRYTFKK